MSEIKSKGGRPKKDESRLLSKTLQVKVTKSESDLLDRYCQTNGIERADYLRKRILGPLHTWSKQQAQTAPELATLVIVAEEPRKAPKKEQLPVVEPATPQNQAPAPTKRHKTLHKFNLGLKTPEEIAAEIEEGKKRLGL